ncbi:3-hydroxybutyryl-CoA dehydrogenase [Hyphomicrobiales bacterium]|nr:3-hydroxybutyryl-CoA dehydrogenase [Hyphomicrobiales bacterium]CAH1673877.1 3-hydroxybutyryl-CoA dehydrogenase [Hyphomicrobiales bacterium]
MSTGESHTSKSSIGVVGAGTMGNGIAQLFAAAGHPVIMRDLKPEFLDRGMTTIARSLERLVVKEKLSAAERDATLARIRPTTDLAELAGCTVVIEAVLEDYDVKARLLRELDDICDSEAIFATNTSSIAVTRLAAASRNPSRVVGMHFFNPVPLMQLVEIIRALQTSDATCDRIVDLTASLGKTARVSKDSYGFVVNRVLVPMINEAINCVHEGVASVEDVDVMMKLGANHPMGPLALADLIGLDVVRNIMDTLYEGFNDPKFRPSPLLKQMCDAGFLGRKTGRGFYHYDK